MKRKPLYSGTWRGCSIEESRIGRYLVFVARRKRPNGESHTVAVADSLRECREAINAARECQLIP